MNIVQKPAPKKCCVRQLYIDLMQLSLLQIKFEEMFDLNLGCLKMLSRSVQVLKMFYYTEVRPIDLSQSIPKTMARTAALYLTVIPAPYIFVENGHDDQGRLATPK